MGLIKAGVGALGGVMADQWKEFFYCEALDKDVLVTKGTKRISERSSNTKASDNIITNGSGIAVADGQCMIIVEQGKIVEVCAEPGEFTFDSSTEPSVFSGSLGQSIIETFKKIGKRFTYGGDTGKDQRIYYFNTKELIDNKFGTTTPIPFRIVNKGIGLDIDVSLRCSGVYSYKIVDPLLFYTNVCGNVEKEYLRSEIDPQLKQEFISALTPALGKLSDLELRPSQIVSHTTDLETALDQVLSQKWSELRGLKIQSVAMNPITLTAEDEARYQQAQTAGFMRDPGIAAATLVGAQAEAMKSAASNPNGVMAGFMGMGMANNMAGNSNIGNLYDMSQAQREKEAAQAAAQPAPAEETPAAAEPTPAEAPAGGWTCSCGTVCKGQFCPQCGKKKPEEKPGWKCACGAVNQGKFCSQCGAQKPEEDESWTCSCGAVNKGKFCTQCGQKKPEEQPKIKCSGCGWEPEGPTDAKFCPECGTKL